MSPRQRPAIGGGLLNGQIDHCRGRYVFGWAIPRTPGTRCRITALDPSGVVIAEAAADVARPDLVGVGGGACDFAFEIGLPFTDTTGPFCILADGVELPGSPLFMEPTMLAGEIRIAGGRVIGWVCNRHSVTVTQPVSLTDQDGRLVMTVQPAPDPADEDPLLRPGRFDAALPDHCFGRNELHLAASVGDIVFASAFGPVRLEGYLDTLTDTTCAGWLFSPDAPERRFGIAVYRDGRLAGQVVTAQHRPDVVSRFPAADACGFEIRLRPQAKPRSALVHMSVRIAGSDRDLFGGPFLIGARDHLIEHAQDALQSAPQADQAPATEVALQAAVAHWLRTLRTGADQRLKARPLPTATTTTRRLTIVIPVYADIEATRRCLDSVLRCRDAATDMLVIVNDNPNDPAIQALVDAQARHPNVVVLRNAVNQGFVASANRGMDFRQTGDVLLLNADTEMFPGAIDELHAVLHADARIGTVTALSNNATLFSYPHPEAIADNLDDATWSDLAAVALQQNAGKAVPIPTAHGFCMLIRRAVIEDIGLFDPAFGRGYGEENDFSLRASDRGWRHVAAGGVLVHHAEARSFGAEKNALIARNLAVLAQRFPEYAARIDRFAAEDPLRRLRWPLDAWRLRRAAAGRRLWLVIDNWLDGGTERAAADIATLVTPPETIHLRLTSQRDGRLLLTSEALALLAVFAAEEGEALFTLLSDLPIERVVVHHLLGFTHAAIAPLQRFLAGRDSVFHVHDFYYACPRVTMIDAAGGFCDGAATDRCDRCLALDGAHSAHRLADTPAAAHRALFGALLGQASHVIAPSRDTAARLRAFLPSVRAEAVPHPQTGTTFPIGVRRGNPTDICLLGAIGPHKGAPALLALARHAALNHPEFRFHVIGFTHIDDDLLAVGNVTISGRYDPADLPSLVEKTEARVALFLHGWPETFSYTLTEAVSLGLIPVVPDIGAPAERVRAAGFGLVVPFPIDIETVMATLVGLADGTLSYSRDGGLPLNFDTATTHDQMRRAYGEAQAAAAPAPARHRRRGAAAK